MSDKVAWKGASTKLPRDLCVCICVNAPLSACESNNEGDDEDHKLLEAASDINTT